MGYASGDYSQGTTADDDFDTSVEEGEFDDHDHAPVGWRSARYRHLKRKARRQETPKHLELFDNGML